MTRRERVAEHARQQVGCKYHDHQLAPGLAYDCATLPWHIYSTAGLIPAPPNPLPHWSPQQWLHRNDTQYLDTIIANHGRRIEEKDARLGDLVLFFIRRNAGGSWTHGGIIVQRDPLLIVHPIKVRGVIMSSPDEGFWWRTPREYWTFFPEGE
jgi:cell wall-associated NlpC family hydrolase